LDDIIKAAERAAVELCEKAGLKIGQSVVVGCSSSEIGGHRIGTHSNAEIGSAVFATLLDVFKQRGVYLAAQCCEHLNRAVIVESAAAVNCQIVSAVPTTNAGGAFATAAYSLLIKPVVVESFNADAGLDIGGTIIGMHLKRVVVPVPMETKYIGKAAILAARTRPPFIGGERTTYEKEVI
jgi:uncharacterized protein (TIGR01440 family)